MEKPGSRSIRMDGTEPQVRGAIHRSSSSEPLLESAPSSHCMAAVAGDEEAVIPNLGKAPLLMASMHEKVVMVASQERPSSPTVVAEGCGGQGRGAPLSYVGCLLSNKVSSVGGASKEEDTSSQEGVQEMEGQKGKQKKKWSWLPDPEKRWPVQGW